MNETVLIVDDDELVLSGLESNLTSERYRVLTARSAEQAITLLNRETVHLVLSDLIMKGMDGIQLLEHVREHYSHVAFIMITGHGSVGRALEAMRQGANDFIQKPADVGLIRKRIRAALDGAHLKQHLLHRRDKESDRRRNLQERQIREQRMVSLGRLADGVSEYLSNLIDPIFQRVADIQAHAPESSVAKQALEIERAAIKAMHLVRHLQTIGHGGSLRMETVDVDELFQSFLKSEKGRPVSACGKPIVMRYSVEELVTPISGSSTLLLAMLENLVHHVVDGMPEGGQLEIGLSCVELEGHQQGHDSARCGSHVVVEIKDTGPDAPAQDMDRLFEPFQPRTIGQMETNTGLGLSVAYRVIGDHHGWIDAHYQERQGTTYQVYLPTTHAERRKSDRGRAAGGNECVLVVDDSQSHRELASTILGSLGYRVEAVASGQEAVKLFKSKPDVDVVVLDLVLADAFDGLETYKKIIEIKPGQRAVLVSGFAEFDRIIEARQLGLVTYVQKPYQEETLEQAVRREIERHE